MNEIHRLLYALGVSEKYTGFFYTVYAAEICMEQPDRLLFVTKWVYPDVARRYRTTCQAVERNIRTVRNVIWEESRPLLEQMAGRPLKEKPGTAQLLSVLTAAAGQGAKSA